MPEVVVIGTGVGGLGCAALLASQGYSVQVFERNAFIGGRCSASMRDGMAVDNFAHIFPVGAKGPLGRIARVVGEPVEFVRHDPSSVIFDARDEGVRKYPQPLNMCSLLSQARMAFNMGIAWHQLPGGGLLFTRMIWASDAFIEEHDDMALADLVARYTSDRQMHRFINTLCYMMFTISYRRASAGEFVHCFRDMFRAADMSYPRGGSGAIPEAYRRGVQRHGGTVWLKRGVTRILSQGGRVTGVLTEDGMVPAEIVISNAGIDLSVELAGEEALGHGYAAYAKGLEYSGSGVVAKYLLDRKFLDMPGIIYIPNAGPGTMFSFLEEGGAPQDLMMMLPVVDRLDPGLVPEGRQLIIAATPGPAAPGHPLTPVLLDKLEQQLFQLFPGMREHVIWKATMRPEFISQTTGRKHIGDSVGLAQIPSQVGKNKPSPITPLHGLYLVGMDAGARGIGTAQAAASAEVVADLITKRHPC